MTLNSIQRIKGEKLHNGKKLKIKTKPELLAETCSHKEMELLLYEDSDNH